MTLRGYQRDAIGALEKDWAGGLLRLGIALPTGTGKTHVMAELASQYALSRVLVLVHRDTLVEQTERKMRDALAAGPVQRSLAGQQPSRGATVGVVKAARNVVGADVIVASVHTLRNPARLAQIPRPSLIIVDEAHVSMSATYETVFAAFPGARIAGFTATWVRSDAKKLGDFWQKISYQRNIRWAIREGHLVVPRGIAVGVPEGLLDGVRTRRGDYVDSDLGEALSVEEVRTNVVRGYTQHAADRSSILFAPTRAAAEYFADGLRAAGVPTEGVYAGTGPRDRRRIFEAYRRRQISVLTTCTALAEGWDAPWCSAALLVRPTRHIGMYVQQIGRVLRPWPGKSDALVLDFAGGSDGMSLQLDAMLSKTELWEDDPLSDEDEELDALPPGDADDELFFRAGKGTRPVDLFAGTDVVWLTTELGVPFVATTTALYFLAEVDGAWNVGTCRPDSLTGGRWLLEGVSSAEALSYASIVAVDDDPSLAAVDAHWRRDRKPSAAQINLARSWGVSVAAADTKSSLSNKFSVRRASSTLAPIGMR